MDTTPPEPQKTGQQLRTETITIVNAAITASGLPDGWGSEWVGDSILWNPDTVEFIGAGCSTTDTGEDSRRYEVDLYHAPVVGEAVAFAHKMGDYWKAQGYTVTT